MGALSQKANNIKYTLNHRKAFRGLERRLLRHNTFRSLFHDLDKVFLYMIKDTWRLCSDGH